MFLWVLSSATPCASFILDRTAECLVRAVVWMARCTVLCFWGSSHSTARHTICTYVLWQPFCLGIVFNGLAVLLNPILGVNPYQSPFCPSRYLTAMASVYRSSSPRFRYYDVICNLQTSFEILIWHNCLLLEMVTTRVGRLRDQS